MKAVKVLQTAEDLIQERGLAYGHPAINHMRIAQFWSTYLEAPIKPEQVAIMMVLVKVARLVESPGHEDSFIDLTAYSALAGELSLMDWEDFNAYCEE